MVNRKIKYPKLAIFCQLSTVNCQLSTVNCQLSTVNCQLSTSYRISNSPQTSTLCPASDKTSQYNILLKAIPD